MRIIVLSILLSFSSVLCAQNKKWIDHKAQESKISFMMPNNIQIIEKDTYGYKSQVFQTKDLTCVYGIVATYFKDQNFSRQSTTELYEGMKAGSLSEKACILLNEQSCIYEKIIGKEIKYSTIYNKMEYTYYKRFFFKGEYIYQLNVGAATRHIKELEVNKEIFFNSLKFL